jgi:pyruvate dehydrogenase E2 component (dihydrolipoamide acetyltransferase)
MAVSVMASAERSSRSGATWRKTGYDMQGACFTISSLGHIGGTGFTPIVNAPEVAILGVSKATIQPVWDGKAFQPKLMLPLSLSYDHRVINGAAAARFTKRLGEVLTDIRTMLL